MALRAKLVNKRLPFVRNVHISRKVSGDCHGVVEQAGAIAACAPCAEEFQWGWRGFGRGRLGVFAPAGDIEQQNSDEGRGPHARIIWGEESKSLSGGKSQWS